MRTAFFDMEPGLRQIEGMLKLLSILGEAGASVEPLALAALARLSNCPSNGAPDSRYQEYLERVAMIELAELIFRWTPVRQQALVG
jgi:hypothetical protein